MKKRAKPFPYGRWMMLFFAALAFAWVGSQIWGD